jgi:DNA-3-methyladenine glycosylase II
MWFDKPPAHPDWSKARRQLCRADPALATIIRRIGRCTLAPRRDYFVTLCRSIYSQQISTRIATVLFARFAALFPRQRPTPARTIELLSGGLDEEAIRRIGLSRQKRAYLIDLARHFADGSHA